MIYSIQHRTTYKYNYPVSVADHVACLTPRSLTNARLELHELVIDPVPARLTKRTDYFGNRLCFFTIEKAHERLIVEAKSRVAITSEAAANSSLNNPWENSARPLDHRFTAEALEAYQFRFESPRIRIRPEFAEYASRSFAASRPLREALLDLTARIHADFRFDAKVTTVRTTIEEVFKMRRGVCQDFAHIQIACLRSIGIAARYVSGYLRTYPPAGRPRLIGADASHAWVSAYGDGFGWLDLDPTNDVVPSDGHVTLAWGRDYGDVSPLRGQILGGGRHTLKVAVDMEPVEA
jgi:transglutaminase-like putative cysteine protease